MKYWLKGSNYQRYAHIKKKPRNCFIENGFFIFNQKKKVYVDALGTTTTYEQYLTSLFPGINITVTTKADSKFKIVGAASVAAKVTRDCCIEGWYFEEESEADSGIKPWSRQLGSGYPSGEPLSQRKTWGWNFIAQTLTPKPG